MGPVRALHGVERDGRIVASLDDISAPVPAAGEVLLEVAASGVNRADLLQIAGQYPSPAGEPPGLGLEAAGTLPSGARVCALVAGGAHAEFAAVPEGQLIPLPASMDFPTGAAIPEAFLTAFLNLAVEGGLEPGHTVLVHAGASGVGLAAIQVAKYLGARVAATTRTRAKLEAMEAAGADLVLQSRGGEFAQAIEARWGRDAVHVVLDPVGQATVAGDLAVLAPRGRVIMLSAMSGGAATLDLGIVLRKRAEIRGSTLRARPRSEKAALVARFRRELLPGFEAGSLRANVDAVVPAAQAAEAFERMRADVNTGKLVLRWRER